MNTSLAKRPRRLVLADLRGERAPEPATLGRLRTLLNVLPLDILDRLRPLGLDIARLGLEEIRKTATELVDPPETAESGDSGWLRDVWCTPDGTRSLSVRMDRGFVHALCEGMFGGHGLEPPPPEERPFSRIEKGLGAQMVQMCMELVSSALAELSPARPVFSPVSDRDPRDSVCSDTIALEGVYLLESQGCTGELVVGLGRTTLGLFPDLKPKSGGTDRQEIFTAVPVGAAALMMGEAEVELTFTLPAFSLDLEQISCLVPGQILPLSSGLEAPVGIFCEGRCLAEASLARSATRLVVTVRDAAPARFREDQS